MADTEKGTVELLLDMKEQISQGLEKIEKTAEKSLGATEKLSKKTESSFTKLGKALPLARFASFAGAIALITMAFSGVISTGAEFEQTMANLQAVSTPTADEFVRISEKAREMGATTASSAVEAGQGMIELAKQGFKATQQIEAINAVLNIANGTGEEMGKSAEVMAATLSQYGLEASEAAHVSDVMAKSFNSSALNLERFSEAMKFAGPAAKASGESLESTTAALELLSNNAINGTMAGNAVKRMMIDLSTESSKASKVLAGLGVESTSSFEEKLISLNEAGLNFSETAEIFGKISATSAQVLIDNAGKLDGYTKSLENANDAAKDMAKTRLDTLQGDIKLLSSASSELGIILSEGTNPIIRSLTRATTQAITAFNDLANGTNSAALAENKLNQSIVQNEIETRELINGVVDLSEAYKGQTEAGIGVASNTNLIAKRTELLREEYRLLGEQAEKTGRAISGGDLESVSAQGEGQRFKGRIGELVIPGDEDGGKKKKFDDQFDSFIQADTMAEDAQERARAFREEFEEKQKIRDEDRSRSEQRLVELEEQKNRELEIKRQAIEEEKALFDEIGEADKKRSAEAKKNSEKKIEMEKALSDAVWDSSQKLISAGMQALGASKKNAKARKKIALAQVLMEGAVASAKVWADLGWPAAIAPQIQIAAQTTAQAGIIASQSFARGGVVQQEAGKAPTGDNHLIRVNPGEEVLTQNDPRHSNNNQMGGSTYNITVTGNVGTNESKLAEMVAAAIDNIQRTARPVGFGL